MSSSSPLACTLDPAEQPGRSAEIGLIGADALRSIERGENTTVLRFRRTSDIRRRLDDLVAKESRCCAFLEKFEVSEEGETLTLSITAPPGGELILDQLVELIAGSGADR